MQIILSRSRPSRKYNHLHKSIQVLHEIKRDNAPETKVKINQRLWRHLSAMRTIISLPFKKYPTYLPSIIFQFCLSPLLQDFDIDYLPSACWMKDLSPLALAHWLDTIFAFCTGYIDRLCQWYVKWNTLSLSLSVFPFSLQGIFYVYGRFSTPAFYHILGVGLTAYFSNHSPFSREHIIVDFNEFPSPFMY